MRSKDLVERADPCAHHLIGPKADGYHCAPHQLSRLSQAKLPDLVCLILDSIRAPMALSFPQILTLG